MAVKAGIAVSGEMLRRRDNARIKAALGKSFRKDSDFMGISSERPGADDGRLQVRIEVNDRGKIDVDAQRLYLPVDIIAGIFK